MPPNRSVTSRTESSIAARSYCLFASRIPRCGILPLRSPPAGGAHPEGVGFAAANYLVATIGGEFAGLSATAGEGRRAARRRRRRASRSAPAATNIAVTSRGLLDATDARAEPGVDLLERLGALGVERLAAGVLRDRRERLAVGRHRDHLLLAGRAGDDRPAVGAERDREDGDAGDLGAAPRPGRG